MSSNYYEFYAAAFGPVLAEQATDEGEAELTDDLRRRALAAWSMPPGAMRAVYRRCAEELAERSDA